VATTLHQALSSLSFQEHHFSLPVVSEERMTQLLALAERDYGALADTERDALLRELAHKLTEQFLSDVRTTLTRALEVSEKEGNETRSQMILATLHTLNQRRHMET
jgi:hypothetical protein